MDRETAERLAAAAEEVGRHTHVVIMVNATPPARVMLTADGLKAFAAAMHVPYTIQPYQYKGDGYIFPWQAELQHNGLRYYTLLSNEEYAHLKDGLQAPVP